MPWTLLIRLLGAFAVGRLLRRGRRPLVAPSTTPAELRRRARLLIDDGRLFGHIVIVAGFAAASAVGAIVAVTLLALGPQWLGAVVATIATGALGFAALETRRVRRSIARRRRRTRLNVVGEEGEAGDPP